MTSLEGLGFRRIEHKNGLSFFATKPLVKITRAILDMLEAEVKVHGCNVRICLHQEPSDPYHDMIIAERKGSYPTHRHPLKTETLHVIYGQLIVDIFSEEGEKTDEIVLINAMCCRIGAGIFHRVSTESKVAIYHESKLGPFLGDADREFATWSEEE